MTARARSTTPEQLARRVEACELDAADFGHRAHVALAWHDLSTGPILTAIGRFAATLRRFAAHHGVPEKYHETITVAYLLLVAERRTDGGWDAFARDNADLFEDGLAPLHRHYAPARLGSDEARARFLLPDA